MTLFTISLLDTNQHHVTHYSADIGMFTSCDSLLWAIFILYYLQLAHWQFTEMQVLCHERQQEDSAQYLQFALLFRMLSNKHHIN